MVAGVVEPAEAGSLLLLLLELGKRTQEKTQELNIQLGIKSKL